MFSSDSSTTFRPRKRNPQPFGRLFLVGTFAVHAVDDKFNPAVFGAVRGTGVWLEWTGVAVAGGGHALRGNSASIDEIHQRRQRAGA